MSIAQKRETLGMMLLSGSRLLRSGIKKEKKNAYSDRLSFWFSRLRMHFDCCSSVDAIAHHAASRLVPSNHAIMAVKLNQLCTIVEVLPGPRPMPCVYKYGVQHFFNEEWMYGDVEKL